jgi:hypothetical protein
MSADKSEGRIRDRRPYWPRCMKLHLAASYVDESETKFLAGVKTGKWPTGTWDTPVRPDARADQRSNSRRQITVCRDTAMNGGSKNPFSRSYCARSCADPNIPRRRILLG